MGFLQILVVLQQQSERRLESHYIVCYWSGNYYRKLRIQVVLQQFEENLCLKVKWEVQSKAQIVFESPVWSGDASRCLCASKTIQDRRGRPGVYATNSETSTGCKALALAFFSESDNRWEIPGECKRSLCGVLCGFTDGWELK